MNDGFQILDIIFFAMIAAFLVLRLRSALGRRDGNKGPDQNPFTNVMNVKNKDNKIISLTDKLDQSDQTPAEDPPSPAEETSFYDDAPLAKGLFEIRTIDPNFNKEIFLSGASEAFDIILSAYSSGDTLSLKSLLSAEVFSNFSQVIWEREQAKRTMEDTLIGITSAEIVEAFADGSTENITVKFVSEQVNVIREENGEVVDGSPDAVIETVDFWTFSRNAKSSDPNWTLVATNSLD